MPRATAQARISQCNAISFCRKVLASKPASPPNMGLIAGHCRVVRELRLVSGVKFWKSHAAALTRHDSNLRHEFVIGPLCDSDLCPGKKARLYYCIRCNERFLVSGSRVAVLNEDGTPIVGEESLRRFNTFGEGPCTVLEVFASADLSSTREFDEPGNRVARSLPAWSDHPRPLLRVLTRAREGLGS